MAAPYQNTEVHAPMPELPEVETVRRGLAPTLVGRRIVRAEARRPDLRFPLPERFADRLTGARVTALDRRAKYLIAALDTGEALVMHLGMSGRFTVVEPEGRVRAFDAYAYETGGGERHDHVVLHVEGGARVVYNDPRRFGFMDLVATDALETCRHFAAMGPEPLGNRFDAGVLAAAFAGRRTPVKAALLDQGNVAGLGNIYVCEALFRARIAPDAPAGGLPPDRLEALTVAIRDVLDEAIEAGGSTLRDFAAADGRLGGFQERFDVYGREGEACPCGRPEAIIARLVQSGRSTFYCPVCQR
jgi:formamidopyrimidine-DNA glycosylase